MGASSTNSIFDLVEQASLAVHDIRNCINMINLNLEVLQRENRQAFEILEERSPEELELIEILSRGAGRIDKMLTKVKIASNMIKMQQEGFSNELALNTSNLSDLVGEVIDPILLTADKEISVKRDFDLSVNPLINRFRLAQVLGNLFQNAVEAIERGSVERGSLQVSCRSREGGITFEIADNGEGFSTDEISRVGSLGFTTKSYGHGLGIYSCMKIIEHECRGRFEISSNGKDQGCRISFWIPKGEDNV